MLDIVSWTEIPIGHPLGSYHPLPFSSSPFSTMLWPPTQGPLSAWMPGCIQPLLVRKLTVVFFIAKLSCSAQAPGGVQPLSACKSTVVYFIAEFSCSIMLGCDIQPTTTPSPASHEGSPVNMHGLCLCLRWPVTAAALVDLLMTIQQSHTLSRHMLMVAFTLDLFGFLRVNEFTAPHSPSPPSTST